MLEITVGEIMKYIRLFGGCLFLSMGFSTFNNSPGGAGFFIGIAIGFFISFAKAK